ncbi:MAG: uroporphyrinogen decarboxylase family protein [Anaeromyxobacteraceae bacterium]
MLDALPIVTDADTPQGIIRRLVALQPTPRLPVSLLSAGAWTLNRAGLSLEQALAAGPERFAEVVATTNEGVGCDIVWPGSGYHNLALRGVGGTIKFRAKGTPDVLEPLLREPADAERVPVARVREDAGVGVLVGAARILSKTIGGRTVVGTSQWAPFTLGALAFGAERLMRSIYKDKPAAHAVLAFAADLCFEFLEPFIDAGVTMISLADPSSSGDMISRQQFVEFSLPYLTQVAAKVRAREVAVTVHICGNSTARLDLIPGTGAQIMSVDYKVDLARARELLGGRIALAGNMNPVAVMQAGTPASVAAACRECIRAAGPGPGFLLMPGCDIPPTVPVENVRAMVEAAHAVTSL